MIMKQFILTTVVVFSVVATEAQSETKFFGKVKIEFEKTFSALAALKEMDSQWYEMVKDRTPKSILTYHEFIGDSTRSLYRPGREVPIDPRSFNRAIADKNVVYTDFRSSRVISQKPVFEEVFLVEDSVSKIKWKLTNDTRIIAGFECRKAIGILDDTVGIFAFYTDEIMISGGPEGLQGLPGMILGVGIPRLHTTWFATKVEVFDVNMKEVKPATKGKKVNRSTMMLQLGSVLREWGTYGSKMVVHFTI